MISTRVLRGSLAGFPKDIVAGLLQRAGLDPKALRDEDGYVPTDAWRRFWLAAEEHDPLAGIHAAQALGWGHFGVVDYVVGTTRDLRAAFHAFARYFRILNTTTSFDLRDVEGGISVVRRLEGDEAMVMPRHAAEYTLAVTVQRFRMAGAEPWTPTQVTFRAPAPQRDDDFVAMFGISPEFGAAEDGFCVCDADLAMPMKSPDPALCELLSTHGEALLGRLPEDPSFAARVARAISQDLPTGAPSVDQVAKTLGLGRRSLQRKLREEGLSYRDVADQVRQELAARYLRLPQTSIGDVAYMLGFSDPSAFHRAFRQWTGQTPGEFKSAYRR